MSKRVVNQIVAPIRSLVIPDRNNSAWFIGGCTEGTRPTDTKTCDPSCSAVPFSYCQDTDSCRCQNGYRPLTATDGHLKECEFIVMVFNRSRGTDADQTVVFIPGEAIMSCLRYEM